MYRSSRRYAVSKRNRSYTPSSRNPSFRLNRRRPYAPRRFNASIPNSLYATSMPTSMKVCMTYCTHYSPETTSGLATDTIFRLNSIFDPDLTSSGHQPQGHDQWNFLYSRYRVDACEVYLQPGTSSAAGFISLLGNVDASAITDLVVAQESPGTITKAIVAQGQSPPIVKRFNIAEGLGQTRVQYETDVLTESAFGANPTRVLYAHVVYCDHFTGVSTYTYSIQLKYYVTLFAPIQLARS